MTGVTLQSMSVLGVVYLSSGLPCGQLDPVYSLDLFCTCMLTEWQTESVQKKRMHPWKSMSASYEEHLAKRSRAALATSSPMLPTGSRRAPKFRLCRARAEVCRRGDLDPRSMPAGIEGPFPGDHSVRRLSTFDSRSPQLPSSLRAVTPSFGVE